MNLDRKLSHCVAPTPRKERAVPLDFTGTATEGRQTVPDFDRHIRRGIWITALCVMIGAAIVYASKAADDRSAFIRWRHQVLEFAQGTNIWEKYFFPNPPLMPLTLYPFMILPSVSGALCWFGLKVGLTAISAWLLLRMVKRTRGLRAIGSGLVAEKYTASDHPYDQALSNSSAMRDSGSADPIMDSGDHYPAQFSADSERLASRK